MIERVIKRDGRKAKFSERRIREAISQAMRDTGVSTYNVIGQVTDTCINAINVKYDNCENYVTVEEIQDTIIEVLNEMGLEQTSKHFKEYREDRTRIREMKSDVMRAIQKIGEETERDNANVGNNFSAKLLQIASVANKYANLATMPKEHAKAHEQGDIHIHDVDSFNLTINCLQIDTGKILDRGFNTGYGTIRKPKSIESAAELSCILLQSTQNDMFGGQSHVNFDNDMAEYVDMTRRKIREEITEIAMMQVGQVPNVTKIDQIIEARTKERVRQAMQGVCYNLNTMHSRAGSQVPFSSVNIGIPKNKDAALVCEMFLEEYNKGMGKGENMIFPNIIFRLKKGVNLEKNDPYRYLYDLARKVAARRMNPTFRLLDSPTDLYYYNKGILSATMGCRTNVCSNINGEEGPASRGNIAPVSINLVRLGIEAKGDWNKFFKSLEKLMVLCDEQLMYRYDVLKKLKIKDLPFVAGEGLVLGSEGLDSNDNIEPILKQGTWGIGFIGLAETLIAMMGKHHGEDVEALAKAHEIIDFMENKINEFKENRQLNYSLYATPAEGLSGRFTAIDKKKYGEIEKVTDMGFYTNSFHVPVYYNISSTKKACIEGQFHQQCTGGMISYFEIDGGDIETRANYIERHIDYCVNNTDIVYVAYNFRIKYCKDCGENMMLDMTSCPNCGSTRTQGVSRVTGYMSLDERFTPGKVAERAARVIHK